VKREYKEDNKQERIRKIWKLDPKDENEMRERENENGESLGRKAPEISEWKQRRGNHKREPQ
jgi:hypothetical protein